MNAESVGELIEVPKVTPRAAVFIVIVMIGIGAVLLMGCERDIDGRTAKMRENDERLSIEYDNQRFSERKASGENCLKRGGMVVRSSWDGRIVDCK